MREPNKVDKEIQKPNNKVANNTANFNFLKSLLVLSSIRDYDGLKKILNNKDEVYQVYEKTSKNNTSIMRKMNHIKNSNNVENLIMDFKILAELLKTGSDLGFLKNPDQNNDNIIDGKIISFLISYGFEAIKHYIEDLQEFNINTLLENAKAKDLAVCSYECKLIQAVISQDIKKIEKKIASKKHNVNFKDHCGNTALKYAVVIGNKEIVEMLLHAGTLSLVVDDYNHPPLFYAELQNNLEIIDILNNFEKENTFDDYIIEFDNNLIGEQISLSGEEKIHNKEEGEN